MAKDYVFRSYPMPENVYDEMREVAEAKNVAISKVMEAAFEWWLNKVSTERGYYAGFIARLSRYAKEYKAHEKKRVPVKLKAGNATLLNMFSEDLNVHKAVLMFAIFEEFYVSAMYRIEEIVFGAEREKPTQAKPTEQKPAAKPVEPKPVEAKPPEPKPLSDLPAPPSSKRVVDEILKKYLLERGQERKKLKPL